MCRNASPSASAPRRTRRPALGSVRIRRPLLKHVYVQALLKGHTRIGMFTLFVGNIV